MRIRALSISAVNVKNIILTFIPIFVAMGPLGNMPIFISLTQGLEKKEKKRIVRDAIITASIAIVIFLLIGKGIFALVGVTISDFMLAGGILLLIIAITVLLNVEKTMKAPQGEVGIVPLGTPIIVGPAVFTTSLILIDRYGIIPTIISLVLNIAITGVIFINADYITRMLGRGGTRALSKITAIFLAAIAVMMMRIGVVEIIKSSLCQNPG